MGLPTIVMARALYTPAILRLAASVPHEARLTHADATVERRSPVCGSRIVVDVALREGRVSALGQEVRACALGQAAAALMGAHAVGRTPAELDAAHAALADYLDGRRGDPGAWPNLDMLAPARANPARHGSILLPFAAVAQAAAEARDDLRNGQCGRDAPANEGSSSASGAANA